MPRKGQTKLNLCPEKDGPYLQELGKCGYTVDNLARFYKVCTKTVYSYCKENPWVLQVIKSAKEEANKKVIETAFSMATSGKCPTMTIFWLKTQCRWKEFNYNINLDLNEKSLEQIKQDEMILLKEVEQRGIKA